MYDKMTGSVQRFVFRERHSPISSRGSRISTDVRQRVRRSARLFVPHPLTLGGPGHTLLLHESSLKALAAPGGVFSFVAIAPFSGRPGRRLPGPPAGSRPDRSEERRVG